MSSPRAVLVAGGTGGLGRAVVARLLAAGAKVATSYRDADSWRALQAEAGAGAPLFGFQADVADPAQASGFAAHAAEALGGVDAVAILSGGWAGGAPFHEAPVDEWTRMLRTNLDATANLCRAAIPLLRAAGGGSIVAIGSRAAETGGSGMAAYAVAKVGLHALVRVLAAENRGHGVRVNAVLPGTIDTRANRAAMPAADRSGWTPPERIAQVVVFLLSSESAATTGALVPVDAPG